MDDRSPADASIFRWEPPDTCIMRLVGDLSAQEFRRILTQTNAAIAGRSYTLGLIDMSRMGAMSPEARVIARTETTHIPMRGTAVIGASFHHRVIALLATKAAILLRTHHQPVEFFTTEAEARAWLAERRKVVLELERAAGRAP